MAAPPQVTAGCLSQTPNTKLKGLQLELRVIHLSVLTTGSHHPTPNSLEAGRTGASHFLYSFCMKNIPFLTHPLTSRCLPWSWVVGP